MAGTAAEHKPTPKRTFLLKGTAELLVTVSTFVCFLQLGKTGVDSSILCCDTVPPIVLRNADSMSSRASRERKNVSGRIEEPVNSGKNIGARGSTTGLVSRNEKREVTYR
jgi:hypothetical protein